MGGRAWLALVVEVPQTTSQGWDKVPHPAGTGGIWENSPISGARPRPFARGISSEPTRQWLPSMVTLSILAGWVSVGDPVGSGCQNIFRPAEARRCDARWVVADRLLCDPSVEPRSPRVVQTIDSF